MNNETCSIVHDGTVLQSPISLIVDSVKTFLPVCFQNRNDFSTANWVENKANGPTFSSFEQMQFAGS